MKHILVAIALLCSMTTAAKKVKVTIVGTNVQWHTDVRIIVNEQPADFHHAYVDNGQFAITLKVEKGSFIRLAPYKTEPMGNGTRRVVRDFSTNSREGIVLVAEGGKVKVNMDSGDIKGSPLSHTLQQQRATLKRMERTIDELRNPPRGKRFTPEEWAERERQAKQMEEAWQQQVEKYMAETDTTTLPAWYAHNYPFCRQGGVYHAAQAKKAAWLKHPILKTH